MVKCLLKTLPIENSELFRGIENLEFYRKISLNAGLMEKAEEKKQKKFKIGYLLAGLFIFFLGFLFFAGIYLGDFLSPQDKLEKADVVVVISGGETLDRTAEGVKLFKEDYVPYLLFSGAAKTGEVSNAKTMQRYALKNGVPQDKIYIEEKSTSTYENAKFSKDILDKNNLKSMILVTSPYHQRRAYMNFRYVFGKDFKIINHSSVDAIWNTKDWWRGNNRSISLEELSRVMYLMLTRNYDKQVR